VPSGLKRYYQRHHLHFITFSCYGRLPLLASPRRRDALLRHIEAARIKFRFAVVGYVVMPVDRSFLHDEELTNWSRTR
jgi:putative transposase